MANNPTLSSGSIGFEQPISTPAPAPSAVGALADLGSAFGASFAKSQASQKGPSAKELESAALQPFAKRLQNLKNSELDDAGFQRQARKEFRSFLTARPEYASAARGIYESYNVSEEVLAAPPEDTFQSAFNDWSATPEGMFSMNMAAATHPNDPDAVAEEIEVAFSESIALQANLTKAKRRNDTVQANVNAWKTQNEKDVQPFIVSFTQNTQKTVDSLLISFARNEEEIDSLTQLGTLNEVRRLAETQVRTQLLSANFHPEIIDTAVEQSLKPIDNLILTAKNNMEDIGLVKNAAENAAQMDALNIFTSVFGPLAANPEVQRGLMSVIGTKLADGADYTRLLEVAQEKVLNGRTTDVTGLIIPFSVSDPEVTSGNAPLINPEEVDSLRQKAKEDPKFIDNLYNDGVTRIQSLDLSKPADKAAMYQGLVSLVQASEASDSPMGRKYIEGIFAKNFGTLSQLMEGNSKEALDARSVFTGFAAKQKKRNEIVLANAIAGKSDLTLTKNKDGTLKLTRTDRRGNTFELDETGLGSDNPAIKAIQNINTIVRATQRMPDVNEALVSSGNVTIETVESPVFTETVVNYSMQQPSDLIETANSVVGLDENRQKEALMSYLSAGGVNLDPSVTAWCAGFTNATLQQNGIDGTNSLAARSFLNWGQAVETPQIGDVVVLSRGDNPAQGHVGFFKGFDAEGNILILGGNQGDSVSTQAFSPDRLLGYRRPPGAKAQTDTVKAEEQLSDTIYRIGSGTLSLPSPEGPVEGTSEDVGGTTQDVTDQGLTEGSLQAAESTQIGSPERDKKTVDNSNGKLSTQTNRLLAKLGISTDGMDSEEEAEAAIEAFIERENDRQARIQFNNRNQNAQ